MYLSAYILITVVLFIHVWRLESQYFLQSFTILSDLFFILSSIFLFLSFKCFQTFNLFLLFIVVYCALREKKCLATGKSPVRTEIYFRFQMSRILLNFDSLLFSIAFKHILKNKLFQVWQSLCRRLCNSKSWTYCINKWKKMYRTVEEKKRNEPIDAVKEIFWLTLVSTKPRITISKDDSNEEKS